MDNSTSASLAERAQHQGAEPLIAAPNPLAGVSIALFWSQSWPLILSTGASSMISIVDVQAAGYLGVATQAAVGLAEQILFVFNVSVLAIGIGTTAIVSRAWGANNRQAAAYSSGQSLLFSVVLGTVLALMAVGCAHWVVPMFARDQIVISQCKSYLEIYALYLVPFSITTVSNAVFRGIGVPKIIALTVCTELIINIVGDYATVLGNWPVRGLGITGIAGASIAGAAVASLGSISLLNRQLNINWPKIFPLSLTETGRIARIGIPAAAHGLSWASSMFAIFFLLRYLDQPTAALASWTIGVRVLAIIKVPLIALQLAGGSIVGRYLGAKDFGSAYRAGWAAARAAAMFTTVIGIAQFVFAESIVALFTKDPITIRICSDFLRIDAAIKPVGGFADILSGCLQGAGDTIGTMLIFCFTNLIVRLPLAWFLCLVLHCQARGVWLAIAISSVMGAVGLIARFQDKKWLHHNV